MSKIRKILLQFIDHTIEDDMRIYQIKHTPIVFKKSLTGHALKEFGHLPVERNKVIFDNYKGAGFGCNPKYVTLALLEKKRDLDIVWMVKNKSQHTDEFPKGVRLVEYHTKEALKEYFTAGVWVDNFHLASYYNIGLVKRPGQTFIQLWHGSLGIKKIEKNCSVLTKVQRWEYLAKKSSKDTDYWISNSDFEDMVYQESFWDVKGILQLGHPRNDIFFLPKEKTDRICQRVKQKIGIGEEKIFLFVPTFRDEREEDDSIFYQLDYRQVIRFLEKRFGGTWKVALRQHPRLKREIPEDLKREGNIIDVSSYPDMQELLLASDALLTDYSSAIFDFMLSKKPGFLLAPDYEEYESLRGLYYPLESTPFPVGKTEKELLENIKEFDEVKYAQACTCFLEEKGCMEDGMAADRVADLIVSSIDSIQQVVSGSI